MTSAIPTQSQPSPEQSHNSTYAQIVSTVMSRYDVTLIFHQAIPVALDNQTLEKFDVTKKEVARITMPIPAIIEFSKMLAQQIEKTPQIIMKAEKKK